MWAVKTLRDTYFGFRNYTPKDKSVLDTWYKDNINYRIVKVQVTELEATHDK
jgi:hypothetical protein